MPFSRYGSALKLQIQEVKRCSHPIRLDVYGSGCDHNCSYCYARAQMIVGGWNNSRNPKHSFPRVVDVGCLRQLGLCVIWHYGLMSEIKDGSFKGQEVGDYLRSRTNINVIKYKKGSIKDASNTPKLALLSFFRDSDIRLEKELDITSSDDATKRKSSRLYGAMAEILERIKA
jgi:hypothetical protein